MAVTVLNNLHDLHFIFQWSQEVGIIRCVLQMASECQIFCLPSQNSQEQRQAWKPDLFGSKFSYHLCLEIRHILLFRKGIQVSHSSWDTLAAHYEKRTLLPASSHNRWPESAFRGPSGKPSSSSIPQHDSPGFFKTVTVMDDKKPKELFRVEDTQETGQLNAMWDSGL